MTYKDIYALAVGEENNYKTTGVTPVENWEWNMYNHIQLAVLYKNSVFVNGKDDNKPFKNITRPILNLQYRAEGFDVKEVKLLVNDAYNYFKSFIVRKFHEKWARENKIDTFIDEMVESYVDFGGVLVKDIDDVRPEIVPWQQVAFCDQTDFLSGPFALKHAYAPDQLKEMESKGWQNIDDLILLANKHSYEKESNLTKEKKSKTPGQYIEVYEIHGMFPQSWLSEPSTDPNGEKFSRQIHIISLYQDQAGKQKGITLFSGKEKELPFKLLLRDKIYGRALGLGGAEELVEPQVWINYDVIRMKEMLDAASKVILKTTDPAVVARHPSGMKDLSNLEVIELAPNTDLNQVDTFPRNVVLFEKSVAEWEQHAKEMGSATGALLGEQMTGMRQSFNAISLITSQGQAIHDYRKGKIAVFLDEIYHDWIMPRITREIMQGQKFLSELDLEELQYVADALVTCETNNKIKEHILNGETIDPNQIELYKQQVREEFMKGGNKKFVEIFKAEFKDLPIDVEVSIAKKQKDSVEMVDKITKIVQFAFSTYNPQTNTFGVFEDPRMSTLFNQILEYSGLDQVDNYAKPQQPPQQLQQMQQQQAGQPMQAGQVLPQMQLPQPQLTR